MYFQFFRLSKKNSLGALLLWDVSLLTLNWFHGILNLLGDSQPGQNQPNHFDAKEWFPLSNVGVDKPVKETFWILYWASAAHLTVYNLDWQVAECGIVLAY